MERVRLHRNRPALVSAVLLGLLSLPVLAQGVKLWLAFTRGEPISAAPLGWLICTLLPLLAFACYCFRMDTAIDSERVMVTSGLMLGRHELWRFSRRSWPRTQAAIVGVHFVFRGPARVFLKGPDGLLHLATFMVWDSAALAFGKEVALLLGVPLAEIDWSGTEKRRLPLQ